MGAWAVTALGLDLAPAQCSDTRFLFKLLLWGPIVEEIVFRAGLQKHLMGHFHNHWVPNGITSVAFSLAHFLLMGNAASLMVFLPSMCLGYVYQYKGKIMWPIGLHIGFNFIFVTLMCATKTP